jgi:CheY-like chemotaxis protein
MTTPSASSSILVVDDDPDIRDALHDILADAGYDVSLANHGKMALDVLGKIDRPCLILLDMMMPEMDGAQFLHVLRQDPTAQSIPVVLCTASGRNTLPGAQGLLKKPFELDELLATVAANCPQPSA